MHTTTLIDHPGGPLAPPESGPDLTETDVIEHGVQPDFTMSPGDERAAVLLAALDELELRRAALERLVDENLLWRCLV